MRFLQMLPARLTKRWLIVSVVFVFAIFLIRPYYSEVSYQIDWVWDQVSTEEQRPTRLHTTNHTIDSLIQEASKSHAGLLSRQSFDVAAAAKAYRERRGRHPPPGFDVWWNFAQKTNAVVVEDFWDQIYEDLDPFWALEPAEIRRATRSNANKGGEHTLKLHGRSVVYDGPVPVFWRTDVWKDMFQTVVTDTSDHFEWPTINIRLNMMDEPRISVPWEDMNKYITVSNEKRKIIPASEVRSEFSVVSPEENTFPDEETVWEKADPFYTLLLRSCPPDSPARNWNVTKDFSGMPNISLASTHAHTVNGYVKNYTLSTLICHQPDILDLNTALIHPSSTRAGKDLIPLFGGSKVTCNNEIMIPAPMYWKDESDARYGAFDRSSSWNLKSDKIIWRGALAGGIYGKDTWRHHHRLRFMSSTNATQVKLVENGTFPAPNWALPDPSYNVSAARNHDLGRWVSTWADTGFTELHCQAWENGCPYMQPYVHQVKPIPFTTVLKAKYLPDVDGASFSARFRSYLEAYSVPFKASLYREWHDARLMPWKHFIPMDNRFLDFYGIMEYFLGYKDAEGNQIVEDHDDVAEIIAREGREWAKKVLRKEDMLVYTMRLLLEFGRIQDDQRDVLGWVGDLEGAKA